VPKVRLIDADGKQIGIVDISKALQIAEESGLDLVEVAPQANPPVCRLLDYGKYRYELSKKEKGQRRKQHGGQVKEIRLRPKTEEHDLSFKIRHAKEFLMQGNKVRFNVIFRGRELAYQEFGYQILDRVKEELSDIAKLEREPQMEGRSLIAIFAKK